MRLLSLLILLLVLSSCSAKPQPPHVSAECLLIAVDGLAPYLYCKDPHNLDTPAWRLELPRPNAAEKYVCTSSEDYAAGKVYARELNDWVNANCTRR